MVDQLTPGTGWLALKPKRLSLRAYTDQQVLLNPGLTNPAEETAGSTVINAVLRYGGLGTCQGGTLTIVDAPAAWTGLDSRLVLLDLESEHGVTTVYRAVLSDLRRDGRMSTATLTGLHDPYMDGPADPGQHPLSSPLLPSIYTYGIPLTYPISAKLETRRTLLSRACEPYPAADYGGLPNGDGVLGYPSAGTAVTLNRGALGAGLGNPESQGYARPPYTTDWVLRTPDEFEQPTGSRAGIPLFVPRRLGEARADPVTVTNPVPTTVTLPPFGSPILADGQQRTHTDFLLSPAAHVVTLFPRTGSAIPRSLKIRVPFTLEGITGGTSGLYVTVATDVPGAGQQVLVPLDSSLVGFAQDLDIEIAPDKYRDVTSVNVYLILTTETTATEVKLRANPIIATTQVESINTSGITMPDGYYMPWQAGPLHQRTANGVWLVPPGNDTEVGQYVAGVEVTWNRNEARSKYLTGVLPYGRSA